MKTMTNKIHLEGRVYSFGARNGKNALAMKVSGAQSKAPGTEYIGGIINIATDEEGLNVVPVNFMYVTKTTKAGTMSPTYSALAQIINDKSTWLDKGKEGATMVSIDGALALNDFVDANGQMVSSKVFRGSFLNIVNEFSEDESIRNRFELDILINAATRIEVDPEKKVDHEYVTLRCAAFDYTNAILPMTLNVTSETGMDYFEGLGASASEPVLTLIRGHIVSESVKTKIEKKSAFGGSSVDYVTVSHKEWVCDWASELPYEFDTEGTITKAELTKALQDREVYLAGVKKSADDRKAKTAAPVPPIMPSNEEFKF